MIFPVAKTNKQLLLTIERAGKVTHRRLESGKGFTIGSDRHNDLPLYQKECPARHVLFARKNNHYQVRINKLMSGEVGAGDSRLKFRDLILHNLLPRKDDCYIYPLTQDKSGYVMIGSAKISFQFVPTEVQHTQKRMPPLPSPFKYGASELKKNYQRYLFNAGGIAVIIHLLGLLIYWGSVSFSGKEQPMRVVRIMKYSELELPPSIAPPELQPTSSAPSSDVGPNVSRPETQGILGLLTQIGTGNSSGGVGNFLDKGVAKELESVMSNGNWQVGGNGGNGKGGSGNDSGYEALAAASSPSSGIDDILADVNQVQSVALGEKGHIQLDPIGGMSATGGGLGKRSEESVRGVMMSYTGRLTYIYNKYLKHNPELRGKIVVEVTIEADGSVSSAKVTSSNVTDPEFEREILNFVRKWKYPAIDEGTVTVSYPLFFNKVG